MTEGKRKGGEARAASLSGDERKAISMKGVQAKRELAALPRATHGSPEHPLKIGDAVIQCYVLEDGTRVLSQAEFLEALGRHRKANVRNEEGEERLPAILQGKAIFPFISKDLAEKSRPIVFRTPSGVKASGYRAELLPEVCEIYLKAKDAGVLPSNQEHVAAKAHILVRGLARVGIIALVDEATGYQKDRARDALAHILEAFVAKELQPYLKTFPADYYEQLFRLYNLNYPPAGNKSWRPAFFGHITNDVVYARLAPELLPELKKAASKIEKKAKLHQWLSSDVGHPKLKEHLISIVALLKISKSPDEFRAHVNTVHPKFGDTLQIDFGSPV